MVNGILSMMELDLEWLKVLENVVESKPNTSLN